MLEIEKLRKADMFSGALVILLGVFVVLQALQMPMKDSYGGVQNVWYVSPALFPLLVGAMLVFLGLLLVKTAFKAIGAEGFLGVFRYLASQSFVSFLKQSDTIRFYAITLNLVVLVFLLVPRVDFFICAVSFLLVFFCMFYCTEEDFLVNQIIYVVAGAIILSILFFTPLLGVASKYVQFPGDMLLIVLTILFSIVVGNRAGVNDTLRKKYRISIGIALVAPFVVGIVFKYFLLVPMPFEGAIVSLLDAIWYADFWS